MACFRKPLVISSIFLATIATGILFGHQFLDLNSEQENHVYGPVDLASIGLNQPHSQAPSTSVKNQRAQSTSDDDVVIKNEQKVDSSSQHVVVWGTVQTDFGEIVAGQTVVFYSESLNERYSTRSSTHGEFVFADVRSAADYRVTVSPSGMYKRYTQSPINLNSNQVIHNIVLETLPVGMLRGTVVDTSDRPVRGFELTIGSVEKDFWSINVVTDASGAFTVAGFPGGRFQVSSGWQQSFTATGLNFDPDVGGPIRLTVDLGPYSLGGHIYDESGRTFDGAHVVVVWAVENEGVRSRSTRQVAADNAGAFRFTGLGAGDHELIVSAWDGNAFKQTVKQTINLGVDPGELDIVLNTL